MHSHLNPTWWRHIKTITDLSRKKESIFNYRLSRARRIIQNVFGILVSRFRFLDRKLAVKLGTVNKLVSAACAFHNWLVTSKVTYLSGGAIDEENNETGEIIAGRWRSEIRVLLDLEKYGGHRTTKLAKNMRDRLEAYFNNEDAVSWQYNATFGKRIASRWKLPSWGRCIPT